MYSKYKIIEGVLHHKTVPTGPWIKLRPEELTVRIRELEAELVGVHRSALNENQ